MASWAKEQSAAELDLNRPLPGNRTEVNVQVSLLNQRPSLSFTAIDRSCSEPGYRSVVWSECSVALTGRGAAYPYRS